nr:reverse transcriptase domain-containing protein [Tanacetum cinerariifolium]
MKVLQAFYTEKSPIPPPIITPPSLMLNPQEFFLYEEFLSPKKQDHDQSSSSTSTLPQAFEIGERSRKTSLERHEEQIKGILNHLDELSLDCIKHIEDKIEGLGQDLSSSGYGKMPPKRTSTSEAPVMTQAAIRKLVTDSVTVALGAQAATMASISNPNKNIDPTETPVAKTGNYKEFISCQPFYFKGTEAAVDLIRWQEVVKAYAATPAENNRFTANLPFCKRCDLHHTRPCTVKCNTCNNVGHLTKNYRNKRPATGSNQLLVTVICHACGEKWYYTNQCRKTNINAQGRAYLLRDRNTHQDSNVFT